MQARWWDKWQEWSILPFLCIIPQPLGKGIHSFCSIVLGEHETWPQPPLHPRMEDREQSHLRGKRRWLPWKARRCPMWCSSQGGHVICSKQGMSECEILRLINNWVLRMSGETHLSLLLCLQNSSLTLLEVTLQEAGCHCLSVPRTRCHYQNINLDALRLCSHSPSTSQVCLIFPAARGAIREVTCPLPIPSVLAES